MGGGPWGGGGGGSGGHLHSNVIVHVSDKILVICLSYNLGAYIYSKRTCNPNLNSF